MEQVSQQLSACVGDGGILVGQDAMEKYLRDWTGTRNGEALAVARPLSTAQGWALMRVAAATP
jgi:FAD/FMN-containing dehydrogenase